VVAQFNREASQTRDYCVAKDATLRAARPDPSLRKKRLFRMTIELHYYPTLPVLCEILVYVEYTVEWVPHMQIVQIVLDKKLLHAADQAAKRTKRNRSALVRDALREHLRQLELRASEERDRQGYSRHSQPDAEARSWEGEAAWPEE
jgi:hypothetical protein